MKNIIYLFLFTLLSVFLSACNSSSGDDDTKIKTEQAEASIALKSVVTFPIGVAVPADPFPNSLLNSPERQLIVNNHFNSLTAENIMKMKFLHPEPDKYVFNHADDLVNYAEQHNMLMHGHALLWHTQAPEWMNELKGSKADFKAVLSDHITTVASHFSGKLTSWDVVNEAFLDEQPTEYRETIWYKNIGKEYIEMSFRLARAADPKADLYYNDYDISGDNSKLARILDMVDDFQKRNVPIDGIGFQVHIDTDSPRIEDIKASFSKVVKRGIKVRISELDIAVNQSEQYTELTPEIAQIQRQRYAQVVNAYIEAVPAELRGGITVWGIIDSDSWIPGFKKRKDWALLFTDDYQEKPALKGMLQGLQGFTPADKTMVFDWFEYQGNDEIFSLPLAKDQFQNPIVAGFYSDPSITRKGDDYYMATSSFSYVPGVPILHSRDLVNWRLIGHALSNKKQVDMSGLQVSRGIFAPTIRYHDGLFYMITTAVDSGGNFFVTAKDPAGEWSEPYWLPEIGGIDPDIFFDDNGKVYIAHNDAPEGEPLYEGHRAIWLWEYDMAAQKVFKNSGRVIVNGGVDLSQEPIWIEAPHIYKINGWYYLLCAEGGTGDQHSEVVFRTKSLDSPFLPYHGNPILTQRDLNIERDNPITTAGHADIVQTPEGDWWAVFLATRAYDKRFYNTGREAFLLPVTWQNEWPHILEKGKEIPYRLAKPSVLLKAISKGEIATKSTGNFIWRDEFEDSKLDVEWNMLRSFYSGWYKIEDGNMNLTPAPVNMSSLKQPVFIGRRQQHMKYQVSTALTLPESDEVSAGLVAFQNERFHYYFAVKKQEQGYRVFLEQAKDSQAKSIVSANINAKAGEQLILNINGNKGQVSFSYQSVNKEPLVLADKLNGKILSTAVAKGFVGTMLGIHSRIENVEE